MSTRSPPTRLQKRWSARLRTAGALLLLGSAVAVVDHFLPGPSTAEVVDPVRVGSPWFWAVAAALVVVGGVAFQLGRRWQ